MIHRILVGAGPFFLGYQGLLTLPKRYPPGGAGSADTPSGTDPAPDPGQGNS